MAAPERQPSRAPERDRDDDRRSAAAAEAERLAREHSNKREQKRQERVRALSGVPVARDGSGASAAALPSGALPPGALPPGTLPSGAPVARPLAAPPAVRERSPERVPTGERERMPERAPGAERERATERLPDRGARVARPDDIVARVAQAASFDAGEVPTAGSTTLPTGGAARGAAVLIDDVAVEAEELLREAGGVWGRWSTADRISAIAAVGTFAGTMLPWLTRKNADVVLGIGSGGIIHAFVAVAALALLVRREMAGIDERGVRLTRDRQRQRARRTALWLLLLALVSTVSGTWLLLVWGAVRRFEIPDLQIGVGLYLTLAAGLGLSYSGFASFWRR